MKIKEKYSIRLAPPKKILTGASKIKISSINSDRVEDFKGTETWEDSNQFSKIFSVLVEKGRINKASRKKIMF